MMNIERAVKILSRFCMSMVILSILIFPIPRLAGVMAAEFKNSYEHHIK